MISVSNRSQAVELIKEAKHKYWNIKMVRNIVHDLEVMLL